MEFTPYPKTPRLLRDLVITEKIDGTNAQVVIQHEGIGWEGDGTIVAFKCATGQEALIMRVGSRNRWITTGKHTDNFGFAQWCQDNAEELFKLGPGQHFGEWWGKGIGRGYGLEERRWSLFNTARWGEHNPNTPACCHVVPVLAHTQLDDISRTLMDLRLFGSRAAPGFMKPEGLIVYHSASKQNYKVLIENDDVPKGAVKELEAA